MTDRYNDFSEINQVSESFYPGSNPDLDTEEIGKIIQIALGYKNPVVSIQHFLAYQATVLSFFQRKAIRGIGLIKFLMLIQTVTLIYIAYKLT